LQSGRLSLRVEFLAIDTARRQCVDQLRMHLASFAIIS